jgi:hypothetical protein
MPFTFKLSKRLARMKASLVRQPSAGAATGVPRAGRSVVHTRSNPLITSYLGDESPVTRYRSVGGLTVTTRKP